MPEKAITHFESEQFALYLSTNHQNLPVSSHIWNNEVSQTLPWSIISSPNCLPDKIRINDCANHIQYGISNDSILTRQQIPPPHAIFGSTIIAPHHSQTTSQFPICSSIEQIPFYGTIYSLFYHMCLSLDWKEVSYYRVG